MASRDKVRFAGFVRVPLNKAEKAQVKKNLLKDAQILKEIVKAAESGYKVSISYSQDAGYYTFTLYGNHPDNPNAGYAASLRHSDLVVAISAMAFVLQEQGYAADWQDLFAVEGDDDW